MTNFSDLPLNVQHERLTMLRAVVVLLVSGDTTVIDRLIGDIYPSTVEPMSAAAELVDEIDDWLAGGAA